MIRLLELGLFLAPFAAYALFLVTIRSGGPSVRVLALTLAGLAILGASLAWFGVERGGGPAADYVPARLENGQIVDGQIGRH